MHFRLSVAVTYYGIALFNANATGSLSFLNNSVAVYKVDMYSNGTNTFTMWKRIYPYLNAYHIPDYDDLLLYK